MLDDSLNRWINFYNNIKDPSWPECCNEYEFWKLPDWIQQEILESYNGRSYVCLESQDIEDLTNYQQQFLDQGNHFVSSDCVLDQKFLVGKDFYVYYSENMLSGGTGTAQEYPRVIKYLYPGVKFKNCLNWCGGAGFIGFRFLADGICEHVTQMDCYPPAVEACKFTMSKMPAHFQDCVDIVQSYSIAEMNTDKKFDLVVGRPPVVQLKKYAVNAYSADNIRLGLDPGLKIHQEFFANIGKYLADDGVILLQKNVERSDALDFEQFINAAGLKITKIFREKSYPLLYYMEIKKR
jgi:methylase of polypeptide subunit release factors